MRRIAKRWPHGPDDVQPNVGEHPHVWFHAACGHGRFAPAYGLGEMGQMDDEIQKAWERLDRAITLGWWDLDHLQNDSDLAVLRKMTPERWESLLERLPEMIDWRSWVQMERSFSRGRKRTPSIDVDHLSDALREGVLKIANQRTTISLGTLVDDNLVLTKASSFPRVNNFVLSITSIENTTSLWFTKILRSTWRFLNLVQMI